MLQHIWGISVKLHCNFGHRPPVDDHRLMTAPDQQLDQTGSDSAEGNLVPTGQMIPYVNQRSPVVTQSN